MLARKSPCPGCPVIHPGVTLDSKGKVFPFRHTHTSCSLLSVRQTTRMPALLWRLKEQQCLVKLSQVWVNVFKAKPTVRDEVVVTFTFLGGPCYVHLSVVFVFNLSCFPFSSLQLNSNYSVLTLNLSHTTVQMHKSQILCVWGAVFDGNRTSCVATVLGP